MLPVFLLCSFNVYAQSNNQNNVPGSFVIEDDIDFTITGAGLGKDYIDFVLEYYHHPDDPDNLYWKLDLDRLTLSSEYLRVSRFFQTYDSSNYHHVVVEVIRPMKVRCIGYDSAGDAIAVSYSYSLQPPAGEVLVETSGASPNTFICQEVD